MYAACESMENAYVIVGKVESIDVSSMTDGWLKSPWEKVREKYEALAEKQIQDGEKDYDKVAKGADLVSQLLSDLKTRFNEKK